MFKKQRKKIQSWRGPIKTFDPSNIGDPIAGLTKWKPIESNGIFFWLNKLFKGTRELVQIESDRIQFKAPKVKRMCLAVMAAAMFFFIQLLIILQNGKGVSLLPVPFYPAIAVVAGCLLYLGTIPIVFDKKKGVFWRGWNMPGSVGSKKEPKFFAKLEDIHALQLISEYSDEKNSDISFQLNLVLKDGGRINVADYRNKDKLRKYAQDLSEFLDKPVWNAIKGLDLSQSNDPNDMKTDDPTQFGDPTEMQTEWSPNQTIYPIPIELDEPKAPDGSKFDDPVATKTEWELADSDATSPSMYKLDKTDLNRIEFRMKSKGFGIFLVVMGIFLGLIPVIKYPTGKILFGNTEIWLLIVCFGCIVAGLLFYFGAIHIVFDKYKGAFWKGWTIGKWKKVDKSFRLADIHAFQIIDEWCQEEGSSFMIYQLNIVLKDSCRFNVFEDKNRKKILVAADAISKFLSKPVWDNTGQ
jgi:hypothetical protein